MTGEARVSRHEGEKCAGVDGMWQKEEAISEVTLGRALAEQGQDKGRRGALEASIPSGPPSHEGRGAFGLQGRGGGKGIPRRA